MLTRACRRVLTALGGSLSLALAACGGDATGPGNTPFAGAYTLQSLNGQRLPVVLLQSGTTAISITNDQLLVADGGTWTESVTLSVTQAGQTTTQVGSNQGTWLRSGSSLTLSSSKNNDVAYAGTFATNRLDLVDGSLAFVFTK